MSNSFDLIGFQPWQRTSACNPNFTSKMHRATENPKEIQGGCTTNCNSATPHQRIFRFCFGFGFLHKVDGIDKHGPNLFGCFLFVGWWARTWMQICWQKTHVNIFFVNYIYIYIHINILCTSMSLHTLPKNKSFSHMDMNIKRYTYTKFILYVVFNLVLFF